jgi:hypothetical protein
MHYIGALNSAFNARAIENGLAPEFVSEERRTVTI